MRIQEQPKFRGPGAQLLLKLSSTEHFTHYTSPGSGASRKIQRGLDPSLPGKCCLLEQAFARLNEVYTSDAAHVRFLPYLTIGQTAVTSLLVLVGALFLIPVVTNLVVTSREFTFLNPSRSS